MQLQLSIKIPSPATLIEHHHRIALIGSCFTEHMSTRLAQSKWRTLANPNGILFNPLSVVDALDSYVADRKYTTDQLFYLNELYNHWDFHTQFSNIDATAAAADMNASVHQAHEFLKDADWLIITLGSSYQYYDQHLEGEAYLVANCHRAPGQWFDKRLLSIDSIVSALRASLENLRTYNSKLKVIFTISPVRHIRDGVVENNRSKARLLEAVHTIVESMDEVYYFPAYELAIDILRDYRFYDIDMVHPNYACTQFIWEQFMQSFISVESQEIGKMMKEINTAYNHRTRFPETNAHAKFLYNYAQKILQLQQQYDYLDFSAELEYFKGENTKEQAN